MATIAAPILVLMVALWTGAAIFRSRALNWSVAILGGILALGEAFQVFP